MPSAFRTTVLSLSALLLGVGVMLVGNGLQGTLLSVRATMEAFSSAAIGWATAAYFAGFVAGSLYTSTLVERAGHIRTFSALASIASAVTLAHLLLIEPITWGVLRALSGFCFAGIWRERDFCSDGMSDIRYPFGTIVILPEGEVLAGCCRRLGE